MVDGPDRSPVTRLRWRSSDPDAVADHLRSSYADFRSTRHRPESLVFWTDVVSTGPAAIGRFGHSGPCRAHAEPAPRLTAVQWLTGGPGYVEDRGQQVRGVLELVPTWGTFGIGWDDDVTARTVTLDPAEVARIGAELSGLEPARVSFTSAEPISATLADYWCHLSTRIHEVFESDVLMDEPLVRTNALRSLSVAMLATFPNTAREALTGGATREPPPAEPAALRRAVAYMDSHARDDIGLTEIAAAARVGVRSLQLAFRQHRDTTPLEYLRRIRLEGAHHDLLAADPSEGDRVEKIAAGWGFAHPGRFSLIYRERYGRSPSVTLRR